MSIVASFLRARWGWRQCAIVAVVAVVAFDVVSELGFPGISSVSGLALTPGNWVAGHLARFWRGEPGSPAVEFTNWAVLLAANVVFWTFVLFAATRFDRTPPEVDFEG